MKQFRRTYILLVCLLVCFISQIIKADTESKEWEVISKRGYKSKTYFNPDSNAFRMVLSTSYLHFKDTDGRMKPIDKKIKYNQERNRYSVTQGLYNASFPYTYMDSCCSIGFSTKESDHIVARLIQLAYLDQTTGKLYVIENAKDVYGKTQDNLIVYPNVFPGVDVEYQYLDTKLKQNVYIHQDCRDYLPDPKSYNLNKSKTALVLVYEIGFSDLLDVFVGDTLISEKIKVNPNNDRSKTKLAYSGTGGILFTNQLGEKKFKLTKDLAYLQDTGKKKEALDDIAINMNKIFYMKDSCNVMLTGIPYKWFEKLPQGTIVLDPTVQLPADNPHMNNDMDVTISDYLGCYQGNNPDNEILYVGYYNGANYGIDRILMKFNLSEIPESAQINSAHLKLYYLGTDGTPINRTLNVHQMLSGPGLAGWNGDHVTWCYRVYDYPTYWDAWEQAGVGLGSDASADVKASKLIASYTAANTWQDFNLTNLVTTWHANELDYNKGILIKAGNDNVANDRKKFCSSEYNDETKRPYLEIEFSVDPIVTYHYNPSGQVSQADYGNGMWEANNYDLEHEWLIKRKYSTGGKDFFSCEYTHDAVGNITSLEYKNPEYTRTMTFGYNDLYRLTSFNYQNGSVTRSYQYDPNGNVKQIGSKSLSYYRANTNEVTPSSPAYTYDTMGRVDGIGAASLDYDIFNNMTNYNSNIYLYDDQNRRIKKTENNETTFYINNGLQILAEYDGEDNHLADYIYGVDGIVAKFDPDEGMYFYCKDHLGSTRCLANKNTYTIQENNYYPFGESLQETGVETSYKFTGKELDSGTGLYYFGARYYDPRIGRWLVPDPLAGKYPGLSPYNYAANNPLKFVDPDGRSARVNGSPAEKVAELMFVKQNLSNSEQKYVYIQNTRKGDLIVLRPDAIGNSKGFKYLKQVIKNENIIDINMAESIVTKDGIVNIKSGFGGAVAVLKKDGSSTVTISSEDCGSVANPIHIKFAHEFLGHGRLNLNEETRADAESEEKVIEIEDELRKEQGIEPRQDTKIYEAPAVRTNP